jgi:hypothetical protein
MREERGAVGAQVIRICTPRQAARRLLRWHETAQQRRVDILLRAADNDVRGDSCMALDWVLA